jgi:hypothetical protein
MGCKSTGFVPTQTFKNILVSILAADILFKQVTYGFNSWTSSHGSQLEAFIGVSPPPPSQTHINTHLFYDVHGRCRRFS